MNFPYLIGGGSLGASTYANILLDNGVKPQDILMITGIESKELYPSNLGKTRGLRLANLNDELVEIIIEGLEYLAKIGIKDIFLTNSIIHAIPENKNLNIKKKNFERIKKVLPLLGHIEIEKDFEEIDPEQKGIYKKKGFRFFEEHTAGIYFFPYLIEQLKQRFLDHGGKIVCDRILQIERESQKNYTIQTEKMVWNAKKIFLALGNGLQNVDLKGITIKKPISIWNQFHFYDIKNIFPFLNHFSGFWSWGGFHPYTNNSNEELLGFYTMIEEKNSEVIRLKVASDTSFVRGNQISSKNKKIYEDCKDKFVKEILQIPQEAILNVEKQICHYAVSDYIQQEKNCSALTASGNGYCIPGFCLKAYRQQKIDSECILQTHLKEEKKSVHWLPSFIQ